MQILWWKKHFPEARKCKRSVHGVLEDYASDSSDSSTGTISAVSAGHVNSMQSQHQLIYCEMEINQQHPDTEWTWDSVKDKAFEEVPVLAYFDVHGQGLGAALLQERRPLAYASRALSDAETRYATIEKKMLAIVFALEK